MNFYAFNKIPPGQAQAFATHMETATGGDAEVVFQMRVCDGCNNAVPADDSKDDRCVYQCAKQGCGTKYDLCKKCVDAGTNTLLCPADYGCSARQRHPNTRAW